MSTCPKCHAELGDVDVCGACGQRRPPRILPYVWAATILAAAVVFVAAVVTNVW